MTSTGVLLITAGSSLAALGFLLGAFQRRLLIPFTLLLLAAWAASLVILSIYVAECPGCTSRASYDSGRWFDLYLAVGYGIYIMGAVLVAAGLGAGLSILLRRVARR